MKKQISYILLVAMVIVACTQKKSIVQFQTSSLRIGIGSKGFITEIIDLKTNKNFLATDTIAPLISCRINGNIVYPVSVTFENEILNIG
jgi:hypothetical protein